MGLKMSEKKSLVREDAVRYAKANKKQKTKILDELCATTGYNRKYAIAKLNSLVQIKHSNFNGRKSVSVKLKEKCTTKNRRQSQKRRRTHPKKYGEDVKKSLTKIWLYFHMMCGQRLVVIIRENIDSLARYGGFEITADVRSKLEEISSATVDRLLKDARKKYKHIRGTSTTKAPSNLSQIIPVRTHYAWDERAPGFFETDTVSNDGGANYGEHCFSLTATDVCTTWTEIRALKNRAHNWVLGALDDIYASLPYRMRGLDSDNGSEFKNFDMVRWCAQKDVAFTRSRSYHKNDNCFVEQKNDSVVRNIAGYFRYEGDEAFMVMQALYKSYSQLVNYFYPSKKIIAKTRDENGRTHKKYDSPKTPFTRSLEFAEKNPDSHITKDDVEKMRRTKQSLDIIALQREVTELQQQLFKLAKRWS